MILKLESPDGGWEFFDGIDSVRHQEFGYLVDRKGSDVQAIYEHPDSHPSEVDELDTSDLRTASPNKVCIDPQLGQSGLRSLDMIELVYVSDKSGDAVEPELSAHTIYKRIATDMRSFLMTDEGETVERLT
jgi:hypothetical protein